MELKWRCPDKYKDCIVMLGIFHMIMMHLGIIGDKFSDAGLEYLFIQSEVVATGSVDKALSGKMYNPSVCPHLKKKLECSDTQLFLHAQYALNHLQGNIIMNSPDTDVMCNGFRKN